MNNRAPVYHAHINALKNRPFFLKNIVFSDPFQFAHMHAGVELLAVVKGCCSFFLGGKTYVMNEGDLSFADSGIPHWHYSETMNEVHAVIANIQFESLLIAYPVRNDHRLVLPFLGVRSGGTPFLQKQPHLVTLLIDACRYQNEQKNGELHAWALLLKVIAELVQVTESENKQSCYRANNQLTVIIDAVTYIQNNYRRTMSLAEIAEESKLSISRFSHLFSDVMQSSPINYRNQLRISYAMQQLTGTSLSIEDIAFDAGFESISQFRQLFSEITGLSPSKFRKQVPPQQ